VCSGVPKVSRCVKMCRGSPIFVCRLRFKSLKPLLFDKVVMSVELGITVKATKVRDVSVDYCQGDKGAVGRTRDYPQSDKM